MAQVFTLSDGVTTLNFLAAPYDLANYETGLNQWKDGGIFADSSLTEGSIPVFRQFDAFEEKLTLHITGATQDNVIASLRAITALLESGMEYFISGLGSQCYMAVKGDAETNTRYAVVTAYKLETLPAQFGGAFLQGAVAATSLYGSAYTGIELILRRGIWIENVPGTQGTAIYDASVTMNNTASFVDIPATGLAGDVDPIMRMRITGIPPFYNKVIIGRRTYSRGDSFNAYLNFTDAALPSGVTILNNVSSYVVDANSPSGKAAQMDAPLDGVGLTNAVWMTLDSTLAGEYIGKFRAYALVAVGTEGTWTAGQFIARLTVASVTQALAVRSYVDYPEVELNSGRSEPEVLDFGVIEIPASLPRSGTVQDTAIALSFTDNAVSKINSMKVMQLILIPADESIVDLDLWRSNTVGTTGHFLVLDKLSSPEEVMDIKLEDATSGGTVAKPACAGAESLYMTRTRHLFWIFTHTRVNEITAAFPTGITYTHWTAPVAHNIKVYKLNRYLLPRGAT